MPPTNGPEPAADARERDRYGRAAVWVVLGVTLVVSAGVYALKAAEERSAIIRWLHQVEELKKGVNIWDIYMFPNPPIFPLTLYPLTYMHPVAASMVWYALKSGLVVLSVLFCFRMARPPGDPRPVPSWAQFAVLLLSFRPILSDLHHGNNNIVILFLVVGSLYAWRRGYDVLAGLALALAITYKVTPALFVPYFMYKRSWRVVGSTMLGIGLFLVVVPGAILGPEFNGQCLHMWWHRMLRPFVVKDEVGAHEINQSLAGVLMRFFTEQKGHGRYVPESGLNLLSLDPGLVVGAIKVLSVALVGLLAAFCRTDARRRDDPRLFGEFCLVVLTMLFVSERSWKHHYVTVLLPYTYLVFQLWAVPTTRRTRWAIVGWLAASSLFMLTTSSDIGELVAGEDGHEVALYYGMFFWAGVALYIPTAILLRRSLKVEQAPAAIEGLSGPHQAQRTRQATPSEP